MKAFALEKGRFTVTEFMDFQCDRCRVRTPDVRRAVAEKGGAVEVRFLPIVKLHNWAFAAAEAACALAGVRPDLYRRYEETVFARESGMTPAAAREIAADIAEAAGAREAFAAELSSGRARGRVVRDIGLAMRLGVVATPSFLYKGTLLPGEKGPARGLSLREPAGVPALDARPDEVKSASRLSSPAIGLALAALVGCGGKGPGDELAGARRSASRRARCFAGVRARRRERGQPVAGAAGRGSAEPGPRGSAWTASTSRFSTACPGEGRMPNWKRLAAEGYTTRITSFVPILSPVIWTTIATGVGPDKHRVLDFQEVDPKSGQKVPDLRRLPRGAGRVEPRLRGRPERGRRRMVGARIRPKR